MSTSPYGSISLIIHKMHIRIYFSLFVGVLSVVAVDISSEQVIETAEFVIMTFTRKSYLVVLKLIQSSTGFF